MADRGPEDDFARRLLAAAKAEEPREGAAERALSKVVPSLGVAAASEPAVPPKRTRLRAEIVGALLAAALLFAGVEVKQALDIEAARAAVAARMAEQRAQEEELIKALEAQEDTVAQLTATVSQARDAAARAAAIAALEEATARAAETAARIRGGRPGGPVINDRHVTKNACNCAPGDPLCSCIP
jgi:colicin import membrane protein